MKGTNPTAAQKRYHDQLCREIGCIACRIDDDFNPMVSVHHIDGRTKPMAHWMVLPLCAGHHQDGTGRKGLIAVHPWKHRFQERYGMQVELMGKCARMLDEAGITVPEQVTSLLGESIE